VATLYASDSTACTTYNGTSGDIWYRWSVDCSTATDSLVWQTWATTTSCTTTDVHYLAVNEWPSIDEQRQEQDAEVRAAALLQSLLSEVQRRQLQERQYFELMVEGGEKPARRYRIYRGSAGNIKRLDAEGNEVESWCVHPRGIPDCDVMAGQMLHLMHDDEGLRKTANVTPLRRAA
jgi:hypothetical protein